MRVFAVSDLHADFPDNFTLLKNISDSDFKDDVLIIAGDVADRLERISSTLSLMREKFKEIFYVPGNHELWVRGESGNSIEKFHTILAVCQDIGVRTAPAGIGIFFIVPLFSWYEENYSREDIPNLDAELKAWGDFRYCKWPDGMSSVSDYMLSLNSTQVAPANSIVISFSHFLPREELLPPGDRLRFKGLPRVAICEGLERRIRRLGSSAHVFGHSHINLNVVIDGVRYIQNALLYPRERNLLSSAGRRFWAGGGPLLQVASEN